MEVQREQNKSLGARLVNLLVTVVIAYVLALVAIRLFESHLIFFPNYPGRLEGDWHPRNLPVKDVWLSSSDGTRLHAWWMPKDHAKFTFLAFHGNASNIANRAEVYEFLRGTPANVFALEYRGYGHSEGKPAKPASTATLTLPINISWTRKRSLRGRSSPSGNRSERPWPQTWRRAEK